MKQFPLAQTLSNLNLIDAEKVNAITEESESNFDFLSKLVNSGLLDSRTLVQDISHRFGLPTIDLTSIETALLPTELIEMKSVVKHCVFPVYKHGKTLFVAVVDPTNKTGLEEIKFYTGLQVRWGFIRPARR